MKIITYAEDANKQAEHGSASTAGDGGRIRLHLAEAGAGPPVLLLHGCHSIGGAGAG
jgi:hypothetical protein